MATGLAAGNEVLASALFEQACFDLRNAERMIQDGELIGVQALALAQAQQACEKSLKAFVLAEVGRTLYGEEIRPTHWVWSKDLQDGRLTLVRQKLQGLFGVAGPGGTVHGLSALESFAPRMSWEAPSSEYPWVDRDGEVRVPATYFEDHEIEVAKFIKLTRTVIRVLAKQNVHFGKIWGAVKGETD